MKLVCLLEHLFGQDVLVDGQTYKVGPDGKTFVGNQAHAKALLANASGWMAEAAPLMPLGPDGQPEHVAIPSRYIVGTEEAAPEVEATPYNDPAIVAHESATEEPKPSLSGGPLSSEDLKQFSANITGEAVSGVDFSGHAVTPEDEIRAKQVQDAPRPSHVSSPLKPASATLSKTSSKKAARK